MGFFKYINRIVLPSPLSNFKISYSQKKKKMPCPLAVTPYALMLPSPKFTATTKLLSIILYLPILNFSYTWTFTIHSLLYQASLTYPNVFEVHSCCSMISIVHFFFLWPNISHCMDIPHFVYPFISQ